MVPGESPKLEASIDELSSNVSRTYTVSIVDELLSLTKVVLKMTITELRVRNVDLSTSHWDDAVVPTVELELDLGGTTEIAWVGVRRSILFPVTTRLFLAFPFLVAALAFSSSTRTTILVS
ncbi:hypothetical protein N9L18_00280 [Candidatus Pacebacteria bacterium]|nr:hypothetical protein [Candidatus Paceibacterota bacterium]